MAMFKSLYWLELALVLWPFLHIQSQSLNPCSRRLYLAKAEQADEKGRRCWDNVKVPACGGRCDSSEISDWEFPFKKSHHPVCVHGKRASLVAHLRHCDPDVAPGTNVFRFLGAVTCRCKKCSSTSTACEWLPPNSTLPSGTIDEEIFEDEKDN